MSDKKNATSLNQTDVWVDRHGVEHRIDDMSVRYKASVIRFLELRAPRIVGRALADTLVSRLASMRGTIPCAECEARGIRNPHEWEHGAWHGIGPVPGSEIEAMLQQGYDDGRWEPSSLAVLPNVTNERAVEMVRETPLMQRLISDVEQGLGGDDD